MIKIAIDHHIGSLCLPNANTTIPGATVQIFDRSLDPDSDDASDMYVLDVFGISVLVRLRTTKTHPTSQPQLYIHIDNEDRPATDLAVEVANGGETLYPI